MMDEVEEHNRKIEAATRARFLCVDCGKDTIDEYYMVRDELWRPPASNRMANALPRRP